MNSSNSGDDSNDYDTVSQANTTTSTSNISCLDNHSSATSGAGEGFKKSFSRSKSNIETFSSKTQVCVGNNNSGNEKTKTLNAATNPYDDDCSDRGQADGGSNQQDSDFDEFSSQDDEDEQGNSNSVTGRKEHKHIIEKALANGSNQSNHLYQNSAELQQEQISNGDNANLLLASPAAVVLGRCKALYNYTPKLYDELELSPGDIIEVHAKQDDGWWLGALRNQVGIFPATYVEEIAWGKFSSYRLVLKFELAIW